MVELISVLSRGRLATERILFIFHHSGVLMEVSDNLERIYENNWLTVRIYSYSINVDSITRI